MKSSHLSRMTHFVVVFSFAVCGLIVDRGVAAAIDLPIPVVEPEREQPVDFHEEVMPLLRRSCLACHHSKLAEGGLNLESLPQMLSGGDSGSALEVGDPGASLLISRASGEEEPLMPPEDNAADARPLTSEELGLISLWIRQGAEAGVSKSSDSPDWQPIPPSFRPIYAIDVSPDGRYVATGRGNGVEIHELPDFAEVSRLVDPALADTVGDDAADIDLVQSIAFSPDGQTIASGGYRSAKLWKKSFPEVDFDADPELALWKSVVGPVAIAAENGLRAAAAADYSIRVAAAGSSDSLTLTGHSATVVSVTAAAAGDRVLSADLGGRVILWNAETGLAIAEMHLGRAIESLVAANDLSRFAILDAVGALSLFEVTAGETVGLEPRLQEQTAAIKDVTAVAWIDGETPSVVAATEEGPVVMLNAADGATIRSLDHAATVDVLAVDPQSQSLVTAGRDGVVKVWDAQSGEAKRTLDGNPQQVRLVARADQNKQRQQARLIRLAATGEELQKRLGVEEEAVTKATEAREQAKTAAAEQDKKVAAAEQALAGDETKIAENEKRSTALTAELEKLTGQIAAAKAAEKAATAKAAAEKAAAAKAAAEKAAAEAVAAEKAAAETAAAAEAAAAEAAAAKAAADEAAEAADSKKATAENAAAEEAAVEEAAVDEPPATESAAELTEKQTAAESEREKLQAEVTQLKEGLEAKKKAVEAAKQESEKAAAEVVKLQQALDAGVEARDRLVEAIQGHDQQVANEQQVATAFDRQHRRFDRQLSGFRSPVTQVAFSPDGTTLVVAHLDRSLRVYRGDETLAMAVLSSPAASRAMTRPQPLWFTDDQTLMTVGDVTQGWKLTPTWMLHLRIGNPLDSEQESPISDRVTAIDFHPSGELVAIGSGPPSRSGHVQVFSTLDGSLVKDFGDVHSDTVLGVRFSPDGRTLASSAADKIIRILDPAGGVVRALEGHTHHVIALAWQDDATTIATASADQSVKVWNAEDGTQKRTIGGNPKEVTAIRFVGTTSQVLAAGADGNVRLQDVADGKTVRTFNSPGDFLFAVAVTPDGKRVLAGGQNGTLKCWNVEDGKLLNELK